MTKRNAGDENENDDTNAALTDHEGRLRHVEDVLDKIMTAGHVYARAGEDHEKLKEFIAARDA